MKQIDHFYKINLRNHIETKEYFLEHNILIKFLDNLILKLANRSRILIVCNLYI